MDRRAMAALAAFACATALGFDFVKDRKARPIALPEAAFASSRLAAQELAAGKLFSDEAEAIWKALRGES